MSEKILREIEIAPVTDKTKKTLKKIVVLLESVEEAGFTGELKLEIDMNQGGIRKVTKIIKCALDEEVPSLNIEDPHLEKP